MSSHVATSMKIRLTDINIRHRDVEVPAQCPYCDTNLVPSSEDDGYPPIIGVIDGEYHTGRLKEPDGNGPQDPELIDAEDHFDIGNTTATLVVMVSCGNGNCNRIIVEGKVTYN